MNIFRTTTIFASILAFATVSLPGMASAKKVLCPVDDGTPAPTPAVTSVSPTAIPTPSPSPSVVIPSPSPSSVNPSPSPSSPSPSGSPSSSPPPAPSPTTGVTVVEVIDEKLNSKTVSLRYNTCYDVSDCLDRKLRTLKSTAWPADSDVITYQNKKCSGASGVSTATGTIALDSTTNRKSLVIVKRGQTYTGTGTAVSACAIPMRF